MKIDKVLIAGGTHGNELTGVFLINRWQTITNRFSGLPFKTELLMSNPRAVAMGRRYIDKDLNRCFIDDPASDPSAPTHEEELARALKQKYASEERPDFIIDMHTSTSNMGITLMIESSRFNLAVADYVRRRVPTVSIYVFDPCDRTRSCLRSMAPYAIGLEIGPVSQNLYCHRTIEMMDATVTTILEGISSFGCDSDLAVLPDVFDLYTHVGNVFFPDDVIGSNYLIHGELEAKNYQPLKEGDPLFINLSGDIIAYSGAKDLCPVFVNEAAYYDKSIAFSLVRKVRQLDKYADF